MLWLMLAATTAAALLFFPLGDFKLESGQTLERAQIGYHTWGELNSTRDNVVLVPSWFNGKSGDLKDYVGVGNLLDPTGFYIVSVDALSNGVSTSPSNSETQRGDRYPKITIGDMVESQYRLLQHLGVKRLHAVVGISMGGMQAFQWTVQYPDFMNKAVPIVGTPKMGVKDILLWTTYIKMVPIGNNKKKPLADLFRFGNAAARPEEKQFGELMAAPAQGPGVQNVAMPKSPNDVRRQFEAVIAHDVSRRHRSLQSAAGAIQAKMMIVVATQDKVVSPETPSSFAGLVKAQVVTLAGDCGHNAYKCEKDKLGPLLNEFLRKR